MLANALVSSRLDFCNSLYYGLPQHRIYSLQRVQNLIARLTDPGTGYRDHMTPVLKRLHWLPVQQRIEFKIAVTTFKVLHNQQPQYLANLLTLISDSSRRSSGNFFYKLFLLNLKLVAAVSAIVPQKSGIRCLSL